jgi:hypothetical protein
MSIFPAFDCIYSHLILGICSGFVKCLPIETWEKVKLAYVKKLLFVSQVYRMKSNTCTDRGDLSHPGTWDTATSAIYISCGQNYREERKEGE